MAVSGVIAGGYQVLLIFHIGAAGGYRYGCWTDVGALITLLGSEIVVCIVGDEYVPE
jgi:hypothetical protein